MDKTDRKILDLLQQDATLTAAAIAEKVGLSRAACWRRIQRLQENGVIKRTVAILDPALVNVGTTVFVTIRTRDHTGAWLDRFLRAVRPLSEVTEVFRMSGDVDYLIRMVVPNIESYGTVYKRLIQAVEFDDVSASFVLETIKSTTVLPLDYLPTD
jgi:Lrp/AsnC family transcriptional regulator